MNIKIAGLNLFSYLLIIFICVTIIGLMAKGVGRVQFKKEAEDEKAEPLTAEKEDEYTDSD
jgi:hypothetical protein